MKSLRWRFIVIAVLGLWAAYNVSPTVIYFFEPKEIRGDVEKLNKIIPDWLPKKHVKLGLDLQGGVQLVLGVQTKGAVDNRLNRVAVEAARWAEDQKLGIDSAYVVKGKQRMIVKLKADQDVADFKEKFKEEFPGISQIDREENVITYAYDEDQISTIEKSALEQAERVVRSRVDKWGVAEPVINRRADGSILVQLPGFKDPSKAKELLGRTAQLKFKIVDDDFKGFDDLQEAQLPEGVTLGNNGRQAALVGEDRDVITAFAKSRIPENRELLFQREQLASGNKYKWTSYVVHAATELTGEDIFDTSVVQGGGLDSSPEVALQFTGPGGKRFADITGKNVNKRMAIVLDDIIESAPNIEQKISGGRATIRLGSGRSFEEIYEEANQLSLILKSGAIPAKIEVLEQRQVGSTLGPELANQGVKGILFGLCLVLVFMLVYYRRPGLIACAALILNGLFLLALMGSFGFALTLPGIAGFILTLGMAVDANVLINERIRQELQTGKNAKKAIEVAFDRVFWTIIDANVTTLIAALVLLETNSSGPIRGFAVTLMLGLIVSLFTSLYCTKVFFNLVTNSFSSDKRIRAWLGNAKPRIFHFDFLKGGMIATSLAVIIGLVVIGTGTVRGLNWGVDFAGGTEVMLGFSEDVDPKEIRAAAKDSGIANLTVQALEGGQKQFLLRFESEGETEDSTGAAATEAFLKFKEAISKTLVSKEPDFLQVDFVGPQIGRELRTQGTLSVFYAILGVLMYIALRFDMRFGPGAVVKMVLDVFVMMGFYVFFWRTFDLTSVAAFLTVVGYSVNDTIVIYDRIRENLSVHARRALRENINFSLNETFSRTLNTSITTVLALIGVLIFGSGQIWNFAMAMTIGVIVATLSSTFVASSFILWTESFKKKRRQKLGSGGTPAPAR